MPAQIGLDESDTKFEIKRSKNDQDISDREFLTLTSLSKLTGFPEELLKNELLITDKISDDGTLEMDDLKKLFVWYWSKKF